MPVDHSSNRGIHLGPFELFEPIGQGGMGEVWRGQHRASQVPVAVKVLSRSALERSGFLSAFRNEVRAVAGLDHPHIVLVLDYGQIPKETERRSLGRLAAGSPYLAMEYAQGVLAQQVGRMQWLEIRATLICLLDALAHAHARGVIHRDLKPTNILVNDETSIRPGIKLADFGIAHLAEQRDLDDKTSRMGGGTPYYMAPEQGRGQWQDYGPWTDLYSFGQVATALVWGSPANLGENVPPGTPVPEGFEAWLMRLMMPEPGDRYRRAADAKLALLELGEPEADMWEASGEYEPNRVDHSLTLDTFALTDVEFTPGIYERGNSAPSNPGLMLPSEEDMSTEIAQEDFDSLDLADMGLISGPAGGANPFHYVQPVERRVPPLPAEWRSEDNAPFSMRLVGAGLGLYGLRSIPLVNRVAERDALWGALRVVREEGRARAVLLQGPTGCGKSRLAEWLCEAAHEVGAGRIFRATHSPVLGSADGIPQGIARKFNCAGLRRRHVLRRVRVVLLRLGVREQEEGDALAELLCPATEADIASGARVIQFSTPTERYVLIQRLLERWSAERPVVVWLDDVQWGLDSLGFAKHLLQQQEDSPSPILLVMTCNADALAQVKAEAGLLEDLASHPSAMRLEVNPLKPAHHTELVRRLLGLEGELAGRVEERTAGNPLFAVQLVGDWVHRGLLEPTDRGFRLKSGAQADLPEQMHKVWAGRIARLLEKRPTRHAIALELAAILGQDVFTEEWRAVCTIAGVQAPLDLAEEMLEQRLARSDQPTIGWSFAHGMLRESLELQSREAGRLTGHHRDCAAMLAVRWSDSGRQDASAGDVRLLERLGRHLLAAGELERALEPLITSCKRRLDTGDYVQVSVLLAEVDRAMETLKLPESDTRWGEGWLVHAELALTMGRAEESKTWSRRTRVRAQQQGWKAADAESTRLLAKATWNLGDSDQGAILLREAVSLMEGLDDQRLLSVMLSELAYLLLMRGEPEGAEDYFRRAIGGFRLIEDDVGEGHSLLRLSILKLKGRDYEEARQLCHRAMDCFERAGSRTGKASVLNTLGEVERLAGNLEQARKHYERGVMYQRLVGSIMAVVYQTNLSLVLIEQAHYERAQRILLESLRVFERRKLKIYLGALHAYLLPCVADSRDWIAMRSHLMHAIALLTETELVEIDVARMTERAGNLCRTYEQHSLARECFRLSEDQWSKLGHDSDSRRVAARLAST